MRWFYSFVKVGKKTTEMCVPPFDERGDRQRCCHPVATWLPLGWEWSVGRNELFVAISLIHALSLTCYNKHTLLSSLNTIQ